MANTIKIKRGDEADRSGETPAAGEPIWVEDTKKLYIGDGTTAGGNLIGPTDTTAGSFSFASLMAHGVI